MMHGSDIIPLNACLVAIWQAHDCGSSTHGHLLLNIKKISGARKDDTIHPHSGLAERRDVMIGSLPSAVWDYSSALMILILLFSSGQNITGIKIYGLYPSCVILYF